MVKIAIIGSKGFIGKHIEWYLRQRGEKEIFTYDCVDSNEWNYRKVDLSSEESVHTIDVNVDYIYFFAGLTGTFVGFDKINSYVDVNEKGLYNPQIQISAESGTKRSIFRQKKQNEAFKKKAAHNTYKAGAKG